MKEPRSAAISLGAKEFRALADLVQDKAGLAFDEQAHYLFERRLGERVIALNLHGFAEYIDVLRRNEQELDEVFDALTTKETYFFRQDYQLNAFIDEVLPEVLEAAKDYRRLTVWSAGCSTGEEAYTLAMLLSESPRLRGFNVQVVGTDLCQSNIDAARRAEYRRSAFRVLPPDKLARHFEETETGYRVNAAIRRMCHFSRVNLVDAAEIRSVGRVDVIFCRNVLIYFAEESRKKVTDALYERLLPGGYLCLGHSESLLWSKTGFEAVHLSSDLVYRRPRQDRPSQNSAVVRGKGRAS